MKNLAFIGLLAASLLAANFVTPSVGQEAASPELPAEEQVATSQRLPPGYSEIITNSQRRRIYGIQESYQGKIDELQKQIDAIENERDAEISKILDDDQKTILKFILKIRERNRLEAEKEAIATIPAAE